MAAFLICDLVQDIYSIPDNLDQDVLSGHTSDDQFSSLLDRCGMSVIVDQVIITYIITKLVILNTHNYYLTS
jgi:vacuolar protein sorting-associated protein 13A/C